MNTLIASVRMQSLSALKAQTYEHLHTFKYLTSFWICQYSDGKSAFDSYEEKI